MKSHEHRTVGEAATAGALVQVGGDSAEERFVLSYGDLVALSGDFFASHRGGAHGIEGAFGPQDLTADDLFHLAAIPGNRGTKLGTRDEIICALKVMSVDGAFVDARFKPGGEFSDFRFTATAAATEVERRVRDRFLVLATANGDHFVAPGQADTADDHNGPQSSRFDSAVVAYRRLHEAALDEAYRLGRCRDDESRAMAREAAAQHYLTDAFAAGHLRTPVTAIRCFWHHRYPRFWQSLQRKVAADTASALRELAWPARILPDGFVYDRALAAVKARTRGYPPITLGDLLARVFHDWDDSHGLALGGGGVLFGDGHLEEGVGKELAVAAVRSGIDDVEVAYRLGVSGSRLRGEALYRAVRSATGAPDDAFGPETRIPIPSAGNPPQNWWATDIEALWSSPIVGTTGTTVGMAVEETLRVGAEVSRRLDSLGPGVFEVPRLLGVPAVRRWAARKARQAYHHGFIQGLAQDPRAAVLAVVDNEAGSRTGARATAGPAQRASRSHPANPQPQPAPPELTMAEQQTFVIVGASLAGAKAAQTLHEEGFTGRIVLIGAETERPYERPPLSKGYLTGKEDKAKLYVHDEGWYGENSVELRLGHRVTGLDRAGRQVQLEGGDRLGYSKLLLATGASPRRLDLPGADLDGVHYLRQIEDSERLREAIRGGGRVVVVGAGWIGLETAAAAREYGCEVTVIEPQPAPLQAALGPGAGGSVIGGFFAQVHRQHGVDVQLGTAVTEFRGTGRVTAVVTDDGSEIPTDVVIVGVGAQPNTELAEQAGLAVDNGVLVDAALRTEDPDVYAAGDVANAVNPLFRARIRVEHWANALHGGPAAARSMLGQQVSYDRAPYFFTDQYDVGMEFTGWFRPGGYDALIIRGDLGARTFYAFWLTDDRVVAGMHVNQWDEGIAPVQDLIRSGMPVDRHRLADPAVPLADTTES